MDHCAFPSSSAADQGPVRTAAVWRRREQPEQRQSGRWSSAGERRAQPPGRHFFCPPRTSGGPPLALVLLCLCPLLLRCPAAATPEGTAAKKASEIEVDWTMQQRPAELSHQQTLGRQHVPTKYVRLKDSLRFRCPAQTPLAVHMVSAESALLCTLPDGKEERERTLIGYCGPNSADPRLIIRQYSPLPGKPSFREGHSYFFISTSNGSPDGVKATNGGLCRSNTLRLRIVVLPSNGDAVSSRPADELTDLAALLFSPPSKATPPPQPPPPPHPAHSSPEFSSVGGYPAILTLEENGQRRQVLVHSPNELAAQIDSASQRTRGGALELSMNRRQGGRDDAARLAPYDVSDPAAEGPKWRRPSGERRNVGEDARPPKSVRSPEPLGEPQKLIYVIGYEDGHGANSASALTALTLPVALLLSLVAVPLLLLITDLLHSS